MVLLVCVLAVSGVAFFPVFSGYAESGSGAGFGVIVVSGVEGDCFWGGGDGEVVVAVGGGGGEGFPLFGVDGEVDGYACDSFDVGVVLEWW